MPDRARFLAALRDGVPQGVGIGLDDPRRPPDGLMAGETPGKAIPSRIAEFAAGRRAARQAMALLGMSAQAIPHKGDRAPQWPIGVTGSISHCADLCVAVIGASAHWDGLGVDVEIHAGLDRALWPEIMRPEELGHVESLHDAVAEHMALATFVVKEAVYKAQYTTSHMLFGFDMLHVRLTDTAFTATFMGDAPGYPQGTQLKGFWVRAGGYLGAVCLIRNRRVDP